jgi:hypothetical protein
MTFIFSPWSQLNKIIIMTFQSITADPHLPSFLSLKSWFFRGAATFCYLEVLSGYEQEWGPLWLIREPQRLAQCSMQSKGSKDSDWMIKYTSTWGSLWYSWHGYIAHSKEQLGRESVWWHWEEDGDSAMFGTELKSAQIQLVNRVCFNWNSPDCSKIPNTQRNQILPWKIQTIPDVGTANCSFDEWEDFSCGITGTQRSSFGIAMSFAEKDCLHHSWLRPNMKS